MKKIHLWINQATPARLTSYYDVTLTFKFIIPHATSCGGYNVFDPSVSQSVSQSVLFFLLAQLL